MSKKLTITVDDDVYEGLHTVIGRRRISRFLNDIARPHLMPRDLVEGYRAMATDEGREPGRRCRRRAQIGHHNAGRCGGSHSTPPLGAKFAKSGRRSSSATTSQT